MRTEGPTWAPVGLLRRGETGLDHAAGAEAGGGKARPERPPYPLTDQELARSPALALHPPQPGSSFVALEALAVTRWTQFCPLLPEHLK